MPVACQVSTTEASAASAVTAVARAATASAPRVNSVRYDSPISVGSRSRPPVLKTTSGMWPLATRASTTASRLLLLLTSSGPATSLVRPTGWTVVSPEDRGRSVASPSPPPVKTLVAARGFVAGGVLGALQVIAGQPLRRGDKDTDYLQGGLNLEHVPTGLFVYGAYRRIDTDSQVINLLASERWRGCLQRHARR